MVDSSIFRRGKDRLSRLLSAFGQERNCTSVLDEFTSQCTVSRSAVCAENLCGSLRHLSMESSDYRTPILSYCGIREVGSLEISRLLVSNDRSGHCGMQLVLGGSQFLDPSVPGSNCFRDSYFWPRDGYCVFELIFPCNSFFYSLLTRRSARVIHSDWNNIGNVAMSDLYSNRFMGDYETVGYSVPSRNIFAPLPARRGPPIGHSAPCEVTSSTDRTRSGLCTLCGRRCAYCS